MTINKNAKNQNTALPREGGAPTSGPAIGSVVLDNPFIAAPLAGVTDLSFRLLLKEMGAALVCTEMVSGKGLLYDNKRTEALLETSPKEAPLACQIFGSDPQVMGATATSLNDRPFAFLDINMGCPVQKVVRNGEGSALLKDLDRLYQVTQAVCQASVKPVTVKIRTGWDDEHIVAVEAAKAAEAAGAAAITVHGRTREQMYQGKADRSRIAAVKKAVSIPVAGNGDVYTAQDALSMMDETGCDMVAIARGALGNPWIFRECVALWKEGIVLPPPTEEEKKAMLRRHLDLMVQLKGEKRGVPEMRKHFAWYTKGMAGGAALRRKANDAVTQEDMLALIQAL